MSLAIISTHNRPSPTLKEQLLSFVEQNSSENPVAKCDITDAGLYITIDPQNVSNPSKLFDQLDRLGKMALDEDGNWTLDCICENSADIFNQIRKILVEHKIELLWNRNLFLFSIKTQIDGTSKAFYKTKNKNAFLLAVTPHSLIAENQDKLLAQLFSLIHPRHADFQGSWIYRDKTWVFHCQIKEGSSKKIGHLFAEFKKILSDYNIPLSAEQTKRAGYSPTSPADSTSSSESD